MLTTYLTLNLIVLMVAMMDHVYFNGELLDTPNRDDLSTCLLILCIPIVNFALVIYLLYKKFIYNT